MAESETGQEKTEPATPRKRQRAREEGQVSQSQEVTNTLLLAASILVFYLYIDDYWRGLMDAAAYYIQESGRQTVTDTSIYVLMLGVAYRTLSIIAPYFLVFFAIGVIANLLQVGFIFSVKSIQPKLDKLSPLSGIKRIFSMRGLIELLKSIGKIFLIAPVMVYIVYTDIPDLMGLSSLPVKDALIYIGYDALELALWALLILIILAIIDFVYQRWQHERDLRMTKEEVRQEMKDIQGDPQIKGRIRSIQREMARKRMMEEVPEADVVVTNPTEYAVAIKYDPDNQAAPQVIAKGKHLNAQKIKEIAIEHDVPIVENRPLAQSLYKLVEVGGLIPPDLYQAVAEVLAYVYKLQGRTDEYARETA